jgi:hypothetical protein
MKLQNKKIIQAEATKERKTQIDEGVKIATKVDELRRVHAEEERSLYEFRDKSIETLKKDIGPLLNQKENLIEEIKELQDRKQVLLDIPIEASLKEMEERKAKISEIEEGLKNRLEYLLSKNLEIDLRFKELVKAEEKLSREKDLIENTRSKIIVVNAETEKILNQAQAKIAEIMEYEKTMKTQLKLEDGKIINRSTDLDNRENSLNKRERELNEKEKFINDKYATLERTVNRIKN